MTSSAAPFSRSFRARFAPLAFALHRWAGLITGGLFLITAATGFVLLFTEDANLMGRPKIEVGSSYTHLGPALAEVAAAHPEYALTSVRLAAEPDRAWLAFLRHPETHDRKVADLNPYTGAVIGVRDYDRAAFRILLELHYTYLAGRAGMVASTVVGVSLVILALTGLWIYRNAIRDLFRWPRQFDLSTRGTVVWLHKWTGLWALGLALVWGVTGVTFMTSILANNFGPSAKRFVPADPAALRALPDTAALLAQARAALPDGAVYSFTPIARGAKAGGPSFRVLFRERWPWEKFGDVRFTAQGKLASVQRPETAPLATKLDHAVTALHFGFLGHRATHLLYIVGALIMVSLPLSGFAIWWLKRRARVSVPERTASSTMPAPLPATALSASGPHA